MVSAALAFVYLTGNLKVVAGAFNDYYEHYKILTYGAIALIPLLMWAYRKWMPGMPLAAA